MEVSNQVLTIIIVINTNLLIAININKVSLQPYKSFWASPCNRYHLYLMGEYSSKTPIFDPSSFHFAEKYSPLHAGREIY